MSDDDALLDQADALMHRHRVFVAGAAAAGGSPDSAAERPDEEDDLPLLTDIVAAQVPDQAIAAAGDETGLEQRLGECRDALVLELEKWLDEQLPQLVTRAMDGITDHLVGQIARRARNELLPRLTAVLQAAEDGVSQWPKATSSVAGETLGDDGG